MRVAVGDRWRDSLGEVVELVEQTMLSPAWWLVRVVEPSLNGLRADPPRRVGHEFQMSEWLIVTGGERIGGAHERAHDDDGGELRAV